MKKGNTNLALRRYREVGTNDAFELEALVELHKLHLPPRKHDSNRNILAGCSGKKLRWRGCCTGCTLNSRVLASEPLMDTKNTGSVQLGGSLQALFGKKKKKKKPQPIRNLPLDAALEPD